VAQIVCQGKKKGKTVQNRKGEWGKWGGEKRKGGNSGGGEELKSDFNFRVGRIEAPGKVHSKCLKYWLHVR